MVTVKVGDLCLMDGYRIVLVVAIDLDGISDEVVKVRYKSGEYWVGHNRLQLLRLVPHPPPLAFPLSIWPQL